MTDGPLPTTSLLLLNHFDIERDRDLVADHAGGTGYSELHAINLCGCGSAHALVAPRIFDRRGWSIDIEHDLLGDAVNGEIADDF